MPNLLLVRPAMNSYPYPQSYFELHTFGWLSEIKKLVVESDYQLIELACQNANYDALKYNIREFRDIDIVVFYGHGRESGDAWIGFQRKVLLDSPTADLLKSKVVYTFCCHSAKDLGPKAVAQGAKCYYGYSESMLSKCVWHRRDSDALY